MFGSLIAINAVVLAAAVVIGLIFFKVGLGILRVILTILFTTKLGGVLLILGGLYVGYRVMF
ncbi:hypothetical protein NBM05_07330 [Rothia sp. AR01]|uniref:Uncharacterized protein n=1 Tax=Rothia santali TaxID=2949643 RepID=A0A9X2HFI2_9MICC|nr:hypothetical protein [Rothia santali]MCP3425822.1 hypothetical protein [Rothia santali]